MPEDQLLAELIALRAEVKELGNKIASLEIENATLSENQLIQLRLINELRETTRKKAQPMQKDRADILRALLAASGGKILAKDARKKMHLSKERFSNLLLICDFIERRPYHLDRRQDVIILKSELVRPNC
jgi:regulator of replication initiation timing